MTNSRKPSLDQLRTFLAVYRSGSFSDAARQISMSQPTVTNHIGSLERWFGTPLFIRSANGVEPTPFAHETAATLGDQLDRIDRFISGEVVPGKPVRSVSIGGPFDFMTSCVIPALGPVAADLPQLSVAFGQSSRLLEDLESDKLDLAISTIRPRGRDIRAWPLADEEFWLVGRPGSVDRHASLSTLSKASFVAYNRELSIIRRYWNTVMNAEPIFDATLLVPDLLSVKAAVRSGFGISVLPSYLVANEVATGELVKLVDPPEPPINTVFLCAQSRALRSRDQIHELAELILKQVKDHMHRQPSPVS
ncbi:LysR family transcriptional regulator [Gordonia sp. TBRC 11910]|uniref:LysR family transcriptional regulator n=1 Tax=Gordonia asplenii TaxID=2725283 RepID=A0A848L1C9_9ACTN|nr:LysR family transcriptional regulator [Gordonia asplenii]NMO02885.1 LysR family transcriptional regulator [Gordonia asplenii]